jgi:hypothetical protein
MLPSLIARPRRLPSRRVVLLAAAVVLGIAALTTQVAATPQPVPIGPSIADELRAASWAMHIPAAWFAAPVPRVRRGDVLDVLAVRQGDRAYTVPVAYAVTVISSDDRGLVLEVDESDASAIVTARGSGMLLVPLLRSSR